MGRSGKNGFTFIVLYWIILYYIKTVASNNVNSTNPKFTTTSQSFRAVVGDTTTLPCQVEHLGDHALLWKRGPSVLSAGEMKISRDSRINLIDSSMHRSI